jgi:hypothetical protein
MDPIVFEHLLSLNRNVAAAIDIPKKLAEFPELQKNDFLASSSYFASFSKHLCRDEEAVKAAPQYHWSNAPVEGNVHRLKLIKRSMCGRAIGLARHQTSNSITLRKGRGAFDMYYVAALLFGEYFK